LNQQIPPASRGVSRVDELEVVGLLQEMIDRLVADFGFEHVKMAGEAHLNRTTEPVTRFLLWLERTPEAQVALRLAFQRLTGKPHLVNSRQQTAMEARPTESTAQTKKGRTRKKGRKRKGN
jgi:hypothetical protein